jgi:hypothetical protein
VRIVAVKLLASNSRGMVETLHRFWNGNISQTQERRHDVDDVEWRLNDVAIGGLIGAHDNEWDPYRFVPGMLFHLKALGAQLVAVVRGKDENGVLKMAGLLEGSGQAAELIIRCRNMGIISR